MTGPVEPAAGAPRPARVALVGAGGIGRAHAEAVAGLAGADLVGVTDARPEAARAVADALGVPVVDLPSVCDPREVDLAVVATPPATHPALVETLLDAGVPVLCEKPIATTVTAARRLAELSADTGTPLTVATKFRFVDDVLRARQMVRAGALGDVAKVEVSFAGVVDMARRWNADPAVSGGGVVIDNATHGVDLVRFLVGELTDVLAVPSRTVQPVAVEDSATLLGRTESGVLAQVDVTWSFRRLSPVYCALYGSIGSVEIGWGGGRAVTAERPEVHDFGTGYRKIDCLARNIEAVLAALADGAPPPVTPADAVSTVAAIDAAYASMASQRWTKVEVSP